MDFVVDEIAKAAGLSADQVEKALEGWERVEGFFHGEHAATALIKGTEIHFALGRQFRRRAIHRENLRDFLRPLLERFGFLTTRVLLGQAEQQRFVQRVGFVKTWDDGAYIYYVLDHLPFERKQHDCNLAPGPV